ncbi:alpha/beta hydrolase fold domain-containing protein [Nonomuraea sp. M3C6]|uniref:Alpha/beta hydrolase fold domain-containing protein n=1 Tax=Nonomuraea marmarensis TaxID=3351344 RepID=A0ABW7AH74_9ACTN
MAAVEWATEHIRERVPGARVAIMGDSAGGGLAAATALACRDRAIGPLAAQILVYPMLDDRTAHAARDVEPFAQFVGADLCDAQSTAELAARPPNSQSPPADPSTSW